MGIQDMQMEGFALCSRGLKSQRTGGKFGENGQFSSPRNCTVLVATGLSHKPFRQTDKKEERKTLFLRSSIHTAFVEEGGTSLPSLLRLSQLHLELLWDGRNPGRLQGTLLCSWSMWFYFHHWAQENAFRWQSPVHTGTPWSNCWGKILRHFNSKLISLGATCWDHKKWAHTARHQVGQWWDWCAPQWGLCSSDPAQKPVAAASIAGRESHTDSFLETRCPRDQWAGSHCLIFRMDLLFHNHKGHFLWNASAKQFITPSIPTLIYFSLILNLLFPRHRFLDCVAFSLKKWWVTSRTLTFWTLTIVATLLW